jgi:hypothetical protein
MAESKKNNRVTAPLVIARRSDGSDVYLYRGAIVPEDLADGEAKRLADFLGSDEDLAESDADVLAGVGQRPQQ